MGETSPTKGGLSSDVQLIFESQDDFGRLRRLLGHKNHMEIMEIAMVHHGSSWFLRKWYDMIYTWKITRELLISMYVTLCYMDFLQGSVQEGSSLCGITHHYRTMTPFFKHGGFLFDSHRVSE